MKILLGGRRNGKTLQMVLYSSVFGLPLQCHNQTQVDRVKSLAKLNNLTIPEPEIIKWRYKNA